MISAPKIDEVVFAAEVSESKKSEIELSLEILFAFVAKIFAIPVSGLGFVSGDKIEYRFVRGIDKKTHTLDQTPEMYSYQTSQVFITENLVDIKGSEKINADQIYGRNIGFYASAPVAISGSNCCIFFLADYSPRKFDSDFTDTMKSLASWAENIIKNDKDFKNRINELELTTKELNRKISESEKEKVKSEVTLENIGDGIVGLDPNGVITFVNNQACDMIGYQKDEILGKKFDLIFQMVDEDGREVPISSRPIHDALFKNKKVVSRNYFYKKRDGSKFAVAITATPIVFMKQVIGGVDVFRDITKEYEIDKMKTEFISLASHQLRTPLSAMKWFAEMLLDGDLGKLTEEQNEIVQNIYDSNERMIELVNTLLNISRIESGKIIIDPTPTDLEKLVNEVVKELQIKIQDKKHTLVISVNKHLPMVNIDPKLVRHVYMNLLTNAIKYTPEGGQIIVMISKIDDQIVNQISDNGFGIPKAQQEKVFNKFFRAENIQKVETDGTGLGLYLAKAIIESSKGKIWFESEEGKGTTFWFQLPIAGSVKKEGEVSLDA
jgi:PAS domain S-box-containing protein